MEDCTEGKRSLGKDFQLDLQKLRMKSGDKKGEMQQDNQAPSQNSQIPGAHPKAEHQLPLFLTKSKLRNFIELGLLIWIILDINFDALIWCP